MASVRRRVLASGAALAACCVAQLAHGQTNYDAALIGGRSSLMGGTGVAGGQDGAAPLQNPATTVDIAGTSFVFSTLFLQLSSRSSELERTDLASDQTKLGFNQIVFTPLPNSTCLFADLAGKPDQRQGRQKLSICLAQPEQENFTFDARAVAEGTAIGTGYQNRHIAQTYSKRVYAVGWAYALTERLSLGVTPMLQEINFTDQEAIATLISTASTADSVVGAPGTNSSTLNTRRGSTFAGSVLMGLQYTPSRDWKMGLLVETPGFFLFGNYSAVRTSESTANATEQYVQEKGTLRVQYPLRAAFGLAGRFPWFSFEGNAYLHGARDDFASVQSDRDAVAFDGDIVTAKTNTQPSYTERVRPTLNLGLGVNVPFKKEWAALIGFLTDFGGLTPRQSGPSDDTIFRSRRDRIHGSLGVAWTPPAGSVLLGVRGFYGQGEMAFSAAATSDSTRLVVPQTDWGLSLVVSGQISLEMLALVDPTGTIEAATKPSASESAKKP